MAYLRPRYALLAYALGGLLLGFCNRPLNMIAMRFGIRAGIGTALTVNALMPLLAIGLAIFHRRVGIAWLGAVTMTLLFHLAMTLVQNRDVTQWTPRTSITSIHPVLVVGCIGYGVLGTIAAIITANRVARPR